MKNQPFQTAALTALALIGFAANSLLCRAALAPRLIDPASFTAVRLLSGAGALALIVAVSQKEIPRGGSWISASALFAYAGAFSFSYVRISAGVGALLLFGAVQATMLTWGLIRGERPKPLHWLGLLLAFAGLIYLTLPGVHSPNPIGAGLMLCAGMAWGVYSLRGRKAKNPLAVTAHHFTRAVPFGLLLVLLFLRQSHLSAKGAGLALLSGALASGVGYSLWYAALPKLTAARAAAVQLCVPILAAIAGVLVLGEHITLRLCMAGAAILLGVALALRPTRRVPG